MHIRRNLSPCLLHLSGELFDAGNCSQLVGALLQNRPEVFSGICLCAGPRSNISHPEKRAGCCNINFAPFWSCTGNFLRTWGLFAGIWDNCARSNATSRSQSRQSRVVDRAKANTSFYAWIEDEGASQIVDALVLSHMRYCIQVYGSANAGQIAKLQKVINFAARVVSGRRKYDHISDCIASLGWLPAQKLVTYSDLCLLHKILMTGQPSSISQYLQVNRDRTTRDTRTANHLSLPRVRNNHGKRAFIYRSVTMYNKHVIAKGADGLSLRKLKKHLKLTDLQWSS